MFFNGRTTKLHRINQATNVIFHILRCDFSQMHLKRYILRKSATILSLIPIPKALRMLKYLHGNSRIEQYNEPQSKQQATDSCNFIT